jgi:tRNA-specific adenosine deaminase 2
MTNETFNPTRHAEMVAIDRIIADADKYKTTLDWSDILLYVTVEPCIMCAAALRLLGLRHVHFGTYNERFGGCGSIIPAHRDYMGNAYAPLQINLLDRFRPECVMLLRRFYMRENERAPKPKAKKNRVLKEIV